MTSVQTKHMTFAVQPAAFGSFDQWGCQWATDIDHAYRIARQEATDGNDQIIWRCPPQGNPIKWVTVAGEGIA